MQAAHIDYIESYNTLENEQKTAHKEMLKSIIGSLGEPSGTYPVILGLLLAENKEFTVLLSGNTEPLSDSNFKNSLRVQYKNAVYEYQKRIAIICDICIEDRNAQYRFCGRFTSFDNIDCIAELISVPLGTLRRLQKTSDDRRQISKLRSCAIKMKISLDRMQEIIESTTSTEKI